MDNIKTKLNYDVDTGVFTYVKNGKIPKNLDRDGYLVIVYNKKRYFAHRLAWYFCHGIFPELMIDHINGIKTDNRLCNLRVVTNRENQSNTHRHRSGNLVGATFRKSKNKWVSRIQIDKKLIHLGYFDTEQDAHDRYMKALEELT